MHHNEQILCNQLLQMPFFLCRSYSSFEEELPIEVEPFNTIVCKLL